MTSTAGAFSNSTEFDIWSARWCDQCTKDVSENCPILLVAFAGGMPEQWTRLGRPGNYECSAFEPLPDVVA